MFHKHPTGDVSQQTLLQFQSEMFSILEKASKICAQPIIVLEMCMPILNQLVLNYNLSGTTKSFQDFSGDGGRWNLMLVDV